MRSKLLYLFVVLAMLMGFLPGTVPVAAADGPGQNLPPIERPQKGNPKLDSQLSQLASANKTSGEANRFAEQSDIELVDGRVRVIVESVPGQVEAATAAASALGVIETSYGNLIQVVVPVSQLTALADKSSISLVRLPYYAIEAVTSQGVGLINADDWQSANYSGAGLKIAILDGGFTGYAALLGTELPASVTTQSFYAGSDINGYTAHGTASAEIIYDIAPQAQFYLVNYDTDVEMGNAVSYLIAQGVNIISYGEGWPLAGPGNGTGPITSIVDSARAAGILWVSSIGGQARRHWQGNYTDADANGWHDFTPVDETNPILVDAGDTIVVGLKWNDTWGASGNDYDLYLYDSSFTSPVAWSERVQAGSGTPWEQLAYTATYTGPYYIAIARYSAPAAVNFHLYAYDQDLGYQVAAGSLMIPADSPNAISVGAVPWSAPTTLEPFSSQGPTTDGRIKPDLVAPDGVSTVSYSPDPFYGTSASAPHVAGAAALVKQANPAYTPAQIQSFLEGRAVDLGTTLKDNLFGSGRLDLGAVPTVTTPPAVTTDNATNITTNSAQLNGTLTSLGTATSVNASFQWGLTAGNYTGNTPSVPMNTIGGFSANLSGLSANTTYHFRARAGGNGLGYGADLVFSTLSPPPPPVVQWTTKAPMTAARMWAAAGVIGGVLYVAGGHDGAQDTPTLQAYNPATDNWTTLANMPARRGNASGAGVIDGKLYVAGGWNYPDSTLPQNSLFVYDPVTNSWATKAAMPQTVLYGSGGGASGVINGKLYVATPENGYNGNYPYLHVYDPATNSWTQLASSPNVHDLPAFGVIDNKLYVAGGVDASRNPHNKLDVYDPTTNTWTTKAPMPVAGYQFARGVSHGKLYAIGGIIAGVISNTVYVYDPATDTWTTGTAMPTARHGAAAAVINGILYVAGGGGASAVLGTVEAFTLAAPPPPAKIVFVSDRDGNLEIYQMNADSSNQTRLTNDPAYDNMPFPTPDGSRIAFVSGRDGNREIYVMSANGANQTRLTNNTAQDIWPAWSPDGARITFASDRDGNREIYVMNANGSNQTRLTNNNAGDNFPVWSPDGTKIAFNSRRDGDFGEIYVMDSNGANQVRLTDNLAGDNFPFWSPDGSRLTFSSQRDGNWEVYNMNANGANQMRLTNTPGYDNWQPAGLPGTPRIVFTSNRDANAEIYAMESNGANQTRLTNNPPHGDWSRGRWVAPAAATNNATGITSNSAVLNGTLTGLGSSGTVRLRFDWGTTAGNYTNSTPAESANATGAFSANVTGLSANATYHFRARVSGDGTSYGTDMTFTTTVAPPPPPPLVVQWQKTFGGTGDDMGYSVQPTPDGGYIIAGRTTSFGAGGDAYLVKTDASGNLTWQKSFGGASDDAGYSVQLTADGGYIVSGYSGPSDTGGQDVYLIKADASGNMTWSRTFGGVYAYNDVGTSVQPTADGGYIIAGYTIPLGSGVYDVYLIKTDASGNKLWSKTFGGTGVEMGWSVQPTADGGYIITGYANSFGAGLYDVYLIKTDASGNMLWQKTFGGANHDQGYSVRPTADGGYIITGNTVSFGAGLDDVYLVKTDASGNLVWQKTFGGANPDVGWSVQPTADGGYIITGYTQSFGAGMNDVYLIKTDASGNMLWQKTLGGASDDRAGLGDSVRQTADGGYIIGGYTQSFGAGLSDVYLIKLAGPTVTTPPTVTTNDATNITANSAILNGTLTSLGTAPSVNVFFEYGENISYGRATTNQTMTATGIFSANLTGLSGNTTYHFRAKADGDGLSFGSDKSFSTAAVPYEQDANTILLDHFNGTTVGTAFGPLTYQDSLPAFGQAINLVNNSYVKYAFTSWSNHEGTVEVWIKPFSYGGILNLNWNDVTSYLEFGHVGHFQLNTEGKLWWSVWNGQGDGAISGQTTIPLNQWTHIAASWGPSGTKLYVNGVVDASTSTNLWPSFLSTTYAYLNYWGGNGLGYVDELRISNVARSEFIILRIPPAVTTDNATNITTNSAILNGTLTSLGTAPSVNASFQWGLTAANYTGNTPSVSMNTIGGFSANLTGLSANTTYHFRARGGGDGLSFGTDKTFTTTVAPPPPPPPVVQWQKTFGGAGDDDKALSVQPTADGGYILAGDTNSFGAGLADFYLVKTDASGNLTWQKTFGGASYDRGYSIQPTADGGYIITGYTESFGTGFPGAPGVYLVKTDASGNLVWEKTFGGAGGDYGSAVQPTADGGYIIVGQTDSFGAGLADVYLVKTDASGNMTWQKTFGGTGVGGAGNDRGQSVQPTTDGGYIIAGGTDSFGAGGQDVYLVKTDASGNMLWQKTFGGAGNDYGESVQPTADGGYLIAGATLSFGAGDWDVYLVKTDASGNLTWSKTFGGTAHDLGYSVQPTADSGYIIGGYTWSFSSGSYDAYLIKTDASGNLLWSQTFGGAGDDAGFSVRPTADGGYIFTGRTSSFGAGGNDVYLIKLAGPTVTTPPTVTTDNATNITANSAVLNGTLTSLGTAPSVNASFQWGLTAANYTGNTPSVSMNTIGGFSANLSGLSANTTYHFRARAGGDGLSFGTDKTFTTTVAPPPPPPPVVQWQKTFGGAGSDSGRSVQQTADGGYIITGWTQSVGAVVKDVYLIKTDASGNLTWQKTFGGTYNDEGYSVQQTLDGGYIIAGLTQSFGTDNDTSDDIYLIKTDASGNLTWQKTFRGGNFVADEGYSVQQTTDGGYIIAGETQSSGRSDVYLIKTDASGNLLWSKTLVNNNNEVGYAVQQTADGGYIIVGHTQIPTATGGLYDPNVYLAKTDGAGNLLWSQTFGGASSDWGRSVQQTADGGYIITGWTQSFGAGTEDIYLVKTDASGNMLWSQTFGGASSDLGYSVQQTADGGYIITGFTFSFGAGSRDVYLVKTDVSGNMTWQKTFGGTYDDWGYSVQPTLDGGYIIGGDTNSFGAGAPNVYLIKVGPAVVPVPPMVTTDNATNITANSAILNGTLTSLGTAPSVNASFQWGLTAANYTGNTPSVLMNTIGGFSANLSGLSANTTYHFRARAGGDGLSFGGDMAFTTAVAPPPPPPPVPVAYWTFDNDTTNDTVGSNHGTIVGSGVTFATGKVGRAISFSGSSLNMQISNQYVEIPSLNLPAITVEAWVNSSHFGYYTSMVTKSYYPDAWNSPWNVWSLWFSENTPNPGFSPFVASPDPAAVGQWIHLAGTHDGVTARLYVNGVEKASVPVSAPLPGTAGKIYIGPPKASNHGYQGLIDEVAIWDRALSATDIQQHYQNGLNGQGYLPPTAPGFTIAILSDNITVVKGQTALVPIRIDFHNGFTTASGISFQLLSGNSSVGAVFTPVPLKTPGGVVLKIDTSAWAAGTTQLTVQASEASSPTVTANFSLKVVTTTNIRFYEFDASYNKVYLTTKNVSQQGSLSIFTEAIDSDGNPLTAPLTLQSNNPNILGVYKSNFMGYNIYALQTGSAALVATAPDGFTANLTVNITVPADPAISSISLTPPQITNKYTDNLTFWATGTRPIGWEIIGMLSDQIIGTMDWSADLKTYGGNFKINPSNPPDLGTYLFGAYILGADQVTKLAEAVLSLIIVNDPSYSALNGGVLIVDPSLQEWSIEMFSLEFYQGGVLQFTRDVFMHPMQGTPGFELGSIPPGTYKIKYVPSYDSIKPQWYPNADSIGGASDVTFNAGQATRDIYFFAVPALALKPDLIISEKHEEWIVPGSTYRVFFTIENIGEATAPAGHDVSLSVDGNLIEQQEIPVALAQYASYSGNFTTVITLSGSNDIVTVRADNNDEVDEVDEFGDQGRGNTIAWPAAPDLVIRHKAENWLQEGSLYQVWFTVRNRGNTAAAAGHDAALSIDGVQLETMEIPVSLAPGEDYEAVFSYTANLTGGLDKVLVTADINNEVAESIETNNIAENTIAWPPAPDLVISTKSEQWVEGQSGNYTVHFTVRNIGNDSALAGHHAQLMVDGTEVEMMAIPRDLIPGSFYQGTFATVVTISGSSDNITVTADMHNDVAESDETNNSRSNTWSAPAPPSKPDLTIAEKHEVWMVAGTSYMLSYTIKNQGGTTAPAGHDMALQVDGKFIEFKPVPVSLAPGANYTDNFTTTINLSGSYDSVTVITDFNNEVDEMNEANNRRGNTIAWPAAPDLRTNNSVEEWVVSGSQYRVRFGVRNDGNAPAAAGHSAALTIDGIEIERKAIPVSLAPGQSYSDVFNVTANLTGGIDKVKVSADINNEVIESREDNNIAENTIAWPQAPDLIVNSKFEQWLPGSTTQYNVFFGVQNIGNAPAPAGHHVELNVDGTILEMVAIPLTLNPGNVYNGVFSANVTISGGSDNITVTADMHNDVAESDETNNSRSNTWSAPAPPSKPDLTIAEKHEVWTQDGISYMVSYTIKNQGGTTAPAGHDMALQVDGKLIEFKPVPVSLAPGANYTDNFTTTINLSGSFDSVTVITDFNNEVDESSETNNRRGNTIAWPAAPDLRANNSVEEWVLAGSQYRVRFGVRNDGNAPAASGHSAALINDGNEIERKAIPVSLAPGQSYSDVFNVTINLTGGMDKVKVTADINNEVIESREDNNIAENSIAWPQAPDLIVNSKFEQWLPGSTTQYNVFFGVQNIGNAPAPAGYHVELNVDGTILEMVAIPLTLNPGNTYNSVFLANVTISGGSDNITVTADMHNDVAESDETNNSRSNTWSAPLPDLRVAEKHEEWSVVGSQYIVFFTIMNSGSASAPSGHDVELIVDGQVIGSQQVPVALGPGQVWSSSFSTNVITISGSSDNITVTADINNEVAESDETNNSRTNVWTAKPDLTIIERHEEWVVSGSQYTVSFTIRNDGNVSASAGHDMALQVDGKLIEFKPVPVSLVPGANYTGNFTTLMNLSGSYDSVTIIADFNNEVDEMNELNNRSAPLSVAWPLAPDLTAYKYEEWVQSGTQYRVRFSIRNWGNAQATAGHDAALTIDGVEIERKAIPVSLAPGQTYSDVFNVTANLTGGIDKVKVSADINNEVIESREDNNAYENTIAWPQAPDLVIFQKSEQWLQGSTTQYNVYFGLRNIGNALAPAGYDVQLVVDGQVIETKAVPVALGQGQTWNSSFSTNVTISGSSDNITVTADINSEVAESDETNNSRTNTWSAPAAGVQVSISAPARVAPGRDFTASVSISQVQSFDAANFDVAFNPAVLRLDNVTGGNIGGVTVPVDAWNQREPGRFSVVVNVPGLTGATGSGYLAVLYFHVIGSLGQSSNITLSDGVLSSTGATEIAATWLGDFVEVTVLPGDANGDGLVNAIDITKVERIIAGLDSPTPGADANQDGNINAIDITKVERIIAGLG